MKVLIIILLATSLFSCSNDTKNNTGEQKTKIQTTKKTAAYGKKNFAVVWNWVTDKQDLIDANKVAQTKELTNLWKEGIVQDAYFDTKGQHDKLNNNPNISFFLKSENLENAKNILDDMIMVKENISTYTIFEVGTKWLNRKTDIVQQKKKTEVFVAVWNTITKHDNANSSKLIEENAQSQADAVIKLWKNGDIENVYFDIEGINDLNSVTDFVMFVNANTKEEANNILSSLPFKEKQIATYQLFPVGTFWLGESNK